MERLLRGFVRIEERVDCTVLSYSERGSVGPSIILVCSI